MAGSFVSIRLYHIKTMMKINFLLSIIILYFLVSHIMSDTADWTMWLNGAACGVLIAYWSNYLKRRFGENG